jgi:hypothetical protein
MAKVLNVTVFRSKTKKNNKGVHAKTKTSSSKSSNNYKKPYKGQGK